MHKKIQKLENKLASAEKLKSIENNSLKDQLKSPTDKANSDQLASNTQTFLFNEDKKNCYNYLNR